MQEYKLFLPPTHLIKKEAKNYTKKDAQDFFQFIMEKKSERIKFFLDFINFKLSNNVSEDLKTLSKVFFEQLKSSIFSIKNNSLVELTNAGYSFCFDLGLLVGDLIVKQMPDVKWTIGKGPKTYNGNNIPVIKNDKTEYDILGISIHGSEFALNNNKPKNWYDQYITMMKTLKDPLWFKKEYNL